MKRIGSIVVMLLAALALVSLLAYARTPGAQAGAKPVGLTGVVKVQGAKYLLTDETSKVTYELRGANLKRFRNARVTVQGNIAPSQTAGLGPQAFQVTSIQALAGGAAPAAVAGGVSKGVIIGAGAAAAAGGTVGGLYAAGAIGSNDKPVSPK